MFSYIRMWWLVNRLRSICLPHRAIVRSLDASKEAKEYFTMILPVEVFLKERANKYWFGVLKLCSPKEIDIRMEKDLSLLRKAFSLNYIDMKETDSGLIVSTLPEGEFFAAWTNGLTGLFEKYWQAFAAVVLLSTTLIGYGLHGFAMARDWYQKNHIVVSQKK